MATIPAGDPPVYDERGNVRPRGTEGARPMTYDERVKLAQRLKLEAETQAATDAGAAPSPRRNRRRS